LQEAVRGPPQLERTSSLQAIAFEPRARACDLAFDERCSLDQALDPRRRGDDIIAGDFSSVR